MSYNPITIILTNKKLIGHNYIDWKRNLDIVFTTKQLKWVTYEVVSPIPNVFSTQEEKNAYS